MRGDHRRRVVLQGDHGKERVERREVVEFGQGGQLDQLDVGHSVVRQGLAGDLQVRRRDVAGGDPSEQARQPDRHPADPAAELETVFEFLDPHAATGPRPSASFQRSTCRRRRRSSGWPRYCWGCSRRWSALTSEGLQGPASPKWFRPCGPWPQADPGSRPSRRSAFPSRGLWPGSLASADAARLTWNSSESRKLALISANDAPEVISWVMTASFSGLAAEDQPVGVFYVGARQHSAWPSFKRIGDPVWNPNQAMSSETRSRRSRRP